MRIAHAENDPTVGALQPSRSIAEVVECRAAHSERRAVIPGWRFLRRGNLLISARAVTLEREVGSRPGIFPDCDRLVERAGERAASLLR